MGATLQACGSPEDVQHPGSFVTRVRGSMKGSGIYRGSMHRAAANTATAHHHHQHQSHQNHPQNHPQNLPQGDNHDSHKKLRRHLSANGRHLFRIGSGEDHGGGHHAPARKMRRRRSSPAAGDSSMGTVHRTLPAAGRHQPRWNNTVFRLGSFHAGHPRDITERRTHDTRHSRSNKQNFYARRNKSW